ncbi:hypothetical protein HID58_055763, partial [Brassica napus]
RSKQGVRKLHGWKLTLRPHNTPLWSATQHYVPSTLLHGLPVYNSPDHSSSVHSSHYNSSPVHSSPDHMSPDYNSPIHRSQAHNSPDVWKIMKKIESFLVLFMKLEPKT